MMMQQSFNRRHSPNRRRTRVKALLHIDDRIEQIVIRDVSYEGMKLAVQSADSVKQLFGQLGGGQRSVRQRFHNQRRTLLGKRGQPPDGRFAQRDIAFAEVTDYRCDGQHARC